MKILFISLGCDKNLVDSEVMLGELSEKGYSFTDDETEADAVVINTCCFINDAKEESINTILEMSELKKSGQVRALIVTGCLAQRYQDEIQKEIPEVDAIVGTTAILTITETLERVLKGEPENHMEALDKAPVGGRKRVMTTGGYYAYLKIAEGCDKHCTYCIIPKVRGNYRSIPMEDLIKEAKSLVLGGVKELILVAQETTLYGRDLYGEKCLPKLLRELSKIEELEWIRLLYCYPEEITEELIQVMKEEKKICHYLDIPVQSGSDAVLKRMGRKTDAGQIKDMIGKLRKEIPDICIRTTLIAGFPGETEENHEETMDFVNEVSFDRLGVFTYSAEEDTPAAEMPDQIPEEIKERRRDEIMELQQEIAFDAAGEMTGRCIRAIIEGKVADEDAYVARTYKDAPGVDGYLFISTDRQLMSGDFVDVVITGSNEYDLIGEISAS
ncbi:MAG: 30S ribosomal protein S12 methylthiotransferase RimO [Lachnospiraceae bacterium]|nr:30S ribosomal protein S12 methylthiotransferase RimO [Lachnospiraceae bacterium]